MGDRPRVVAMVTHAEAKRMPDWTIEPLSERWSAEAGQLVERILREEFSYAATLCADSDLSDMFGAYKQPGREAWVALAGGRVAGVITLKETPSGALKMKRFYVDAAWRGRGVAQELLDAAHSWAEREGYQQIVLTTTNLMARARKFYRAHGYEEVGTTDVEPVVLHHYRRAISLRPLGTRLSPNRLPPAEDGEVAVIVERPRGYVEGWHFDRRAGELVLGEYYPVPVPVNYGLAPEWTNPADEDALDVIIMDDRRMRPGEALVGRSVGVLWRPDGDHKLLVEPRGGALRPVVVDSDYRLRVSSWWDAEHQPSGWDGLEGVPRLMAQCRRKGA